jgi:hypothetical protein
VPEALRCRDIDKSTPGFRLPELPGVGAPSSLEKLMTSHRRPGFLARRRARKESEPVIPVPRPSIEVVDGRTRIRHRVATDELLALPRAGTCIAICGMRVFVASLTDPGRRRCVGCVHREPSFRLVTG